MVMTPSLFLRWGSQQPGREMDENGRKEGMLEARRDPAALIPTVMKSIANRAIVSSSRSTQ